MFYQDLHSSLEVEAESWESPQQLVSKRAGKETGQLDLKERKKEESEGRSVVACFTVRLSLWLPMQSMLKLQARITEGVTGKGWRRRSSLSTGNGG